MSVEEPITRADLLLLDAGISKVNLRVDYGEKSVTKASESMEKRLDSMNEFRSTLKDQAATFISREIFDAKIALQQTEIDSLKKIVYIAIGMSVIVEIVLRFVLKI